MDGYDVMFLGILGLAYAAFLVVHDDERGRS